MTHSCGVGDEQVHKLARDAFLAGTAVARQQGLYGAGQDLLKDAFSGNVRGMGPAVAESDHPPERAGRPLRHRRLLRDAERYVVESVRSRATGEQAAAVATSRPHNIAGKYTGKSELEYTGVMEKLQALESRFEVRPE